MSATTRMVKKAIYAHYQNVILGEYHSLHLLRFAICFSYLGILYLGTKIFPNNLYNRENGPGASGGCTYNIKYGYILVNLFLEIKPIKSN